MTGFAFSCGIIVSAAPKISEKKISASMSMFAAAATGLRGTMFTKVLMPKSWAPDWASPCAPLAKRDISSSRVPGGSPAPGLIVFTRVRPITAAISVESAKYPMVLPPSRPSVFMSPMPATPTAIDVKTIGTTVMNSRRRKTCPTG